jgi:CheY-like chemotaxis protein
VGVALFRTKVVDAVLSDLGMAEVNGWEVARAVKPTARTFRPFS